VLYEMLAGHPPFIASSVVELALLHLQEAPPPLSARLPTSLVEIVDRALAKEPAERYADGGEMAEALLDARRRSAGGHRARPTAAPTRLAQAGGARRALVGTAATAATAPRSLWSDAPAPPKPPRADPGTPAGPTAPLPPPAPGPHGTRRAPRMSRRRNVNPAGRRRAIAALGLVIALLGAMVTAAVLIGHTAHTRVPGLVRLPQGRARAVAHHAHVRLALKHTYAVAAAGTVVAQHPQAGTQVPNGTLVRLTVSKGPAPVHVLNVKSRSLADAQRSLNRVGLRTAVRQVPAPGTTPGVVVGQSPAGGSAARGSTVTLSVAEVPQWHTVTTFTGSGSGPFHIIGTHWRIVYRMGFSGTCTWILFCSGPSARVTDATGRYVAGFGLSDGDGQAQSFATGAGTYDVRITPGGDAAAWSIEVQDSY
jgi:serine/threonine-protein kinase